MDRQHETILRIVDGSPALHGDGHVPIDRAGTESGIGVETLLRKASEGRLGLFSRLSGVVGYLVTVEALRTRVIKVRGIDTIVTDGGELDIPQPGQMPENAVRHEVHAVLALLESDVRAVAGVLLGSGEADVVAFSAGRPGELFIPDVAVPVKRATVEVAAVEVDALRRSMAAEISAERVGAARALQTASVGGGSVRAGKHAQKRLSEALEAYVQNGLRTNISSEDEIKRVRNGCALLIDLDGDLPVGEVGAERLRLFRDEKLSQVPASENRVRLKFKTTSVAESIAAVAGTDWPVMSPEQRDLRMQWIRGWLRWLKAQGWIADDPGAALAGESVLTKAAKRAAPRKDEGREAFTPEHVATIFAASWFKEGSGAKPHHYWLPLLGALTGARINELCQLHLEDIKQSGDTIWAIDFNSSTRDKRLKNSPSARVVPVHPTLVRLGLCRWVEMLKAAGYRRLFPELSYDEGKGYSKAAVKWFSAYLIGLGYVRNGRLTFHSFRHTFINALPEDTPPRLGNQLSGHERGGDVRSKVYQKDAEPSDALPYVERLKLKLPEIAPFDADAGLKAVRDALERKTREQKGKEDTGPVNRT